MSVSMQQTKKQWFPVFTYDCNNNGYSGSVDLMFELYIWKEK